MLLPWCLRWAAVDILRGQPPLSRLFSLLFAGPFEVTLPFAASPIIYLARYSCRAHRIATYRLALSKAWRPDASVRALRRFSARRQQIFAIWERRQHAHFRHSLIRRYHHFLPLLAMTIPPVLGLFSSFLPITLPSARAMPFASPPTSMAARRECDFRRIPSIFTSMPMPPSFVADISFSDAAHLPDTWCCSIARAEDASTARSSSGAINSWKRRPITADSDLRPRRIYLLLYRHHAFLVSASRLSSRIFLASYYECFFIYASFASMLTRKCSRYAIGAASPFVDAHFMLRRSRLAKNALTDMPLMFAASASHSTKEILTPITFSLTHALIHMPFRRDASLPARDAFSSRLSTFIVGLVAYARVAHRVALLCFKFRATAL